MNEHVDDLVFNGDAGSHYIYFTSDCIADYIANLWKLTVEVMRLFILGSRCVSAVRLALWKKALIGGVCLLAASVLVLVCVLCFRAKRGRETYSPTESQASFVPKLDEKRAAPSSCSSSHVSSLIIGRREAPAELSV